MFDDDYSEFRGYNDRMANIYECDIMEREDSFFAIGGVDMGRFTAPYQVDRLNDMHHFG